MKKDNDDHGSSNFKYWLWFIVGIMCILTGVLNLARDLIALF